MYETVEELLTDEEIMTVYITTPPATHFDYDMKVIAANQMPLIEKPMVRTFEKFNKIKKLLDEGAIGQLQFVGIRQFQQPALEDFDKDKLALASIASC